MSNSGDNVQLMCYVAKGDLPINIKWLFRSQPIFSHLGIVTTKVGERSNILSVSSVEAKNSGNYTCVATNNAGSYNSSAELYVQGFM